MMRASWCVLLALPIAAAFSPASILRAQRARLSMSVVDKEKRASTPVGTPSRSPPTSNSYSPVTPSSPTPASRTGSSTGGTLVPITPKNIETSAGIVAAGAVTLVFGPVLGILLGLITNYAAKVENDAGEAARGVGKGAIELLNFFSKVNEKYDITSKVSDTSSNLYKQLKSSGDSSSFSQIEESIENSKKKLAEFNEQYKLGDKARTAADAIVDLSEAAIDKALELNQKYSLVDKTKEAAQSATSKFKENIDKTQ